jgi:uncharacterized protein (TIGR02466 family)
MFSDVDRFEFFPTLIWKFQVDPEERLGLNVDLGTEITRLVGDRSTPPAGGTWPTDQNLHENPVFAPLAHMIRDAALNVLSDLDIENQDIAVTGCWANVNPPGAQHIRHNHPNNFLSGSYYVTAGAGGDRIKFSDPRGQTSVMAPPTHNHNRFNSNNVMMPVAEGDLVMFPSWLDHEVPINQSNADRVSIAFNVMFRNYGEAMSSPMWKGTAGG